MHNYFIWGFKSITITINFEKFGLNPILSLFFSQNVVDLAIGNPFKLAVLSFDVFKNVIIF